MASGGRYVQAEAAEEPASGRLRGVVARFTEGKCAEDGEGGNQSRPSACNLGLIASLMIQTERTEKPG